MASDIVAALELDKENVQRTLVVKEMHGCDSSFITSCILGHFIRTKSPVLVISTHKSIKHFHNVGLKMNYNLNRNVEIGLINFYDIGEEFINVLLKNKTLSHEAVLQNIKEKLVFIQNKFGKVNVIFEGLSHFFDMQYNLREVNFLCANIINFVRTFSNSILLFHCNISQEHDITYVLANLLSHKAYTIMEVEHLASGLSNDVSGHLTLKFPGRKFEEDHMLSLDLKSTQYLFKLFDRGVKLLAPGTV